MNMLLVKTLMPVCMLFGGSGCLVVESEDWLVCCRLFLLTFAKRFTGCPGWAGDLSTAPVITWIYWALFSVPRCFRWVTWLMRLRGRRPRYDSV
jgi:hypothetical protein